MNEAKKVNLTDILDGNIAEVTASLEGLSADELVVLLEAEEAGNPRKGVVKAIQALLEPVESKPEEAPASKRTSNDVQAEIDHIESRAMDIKSAQRIHALRDELSELSK